MAFPPHQILAHKQKDVAIQVAIDGMQQHLVNETEISHPRRIPRPSRVWLSPKRPRTCSSRSLLSPHGAGCSRFPDCKQRSGGARWQLPSALTRHVPGRARNRSKVLIFGLKEEPHDSNHTAPLLLYDRAHEFDHVLIKRD